MTEDLSFPSTRTDALARLKSFLPKVPAYAGCRNEVVPGHPHVSRLSPALRVRLIREVEVAEAAQDAYGASSEKFQQEVWWRLYWKGWLEQRPTIWADYRRDLTTISQADRVRAERTVTGASGVDLIDYFFRELEVTGYLHNHSRMWVAAYWIHELRLPWQLGAEHFLKSLWDGDAASNTLSWRWVAGLHTKGKSYLARRSNLEKFVDPGLLAKHSGGLDRLETPEAYPVSYIEAPPPRGLSGATPATASDLVSRLRSLTDWGLWIHDEDLSVERSILGCLKPLSIRAYQPVVMTEKFTAGAAKYSFLLQAIFDGLDRAETHFQAPANFIPTAISPAVLADWARQDRLKHLVALHPFVGPLADLLPSLEAALARVSCELILVRRDEDVRAMLPANGGFFGFWEKTKGLREPTV